MNRSRSKIDPIQLIKEIHELTYKKKLYRLLKIELSKRGWWQNKPREKRG